MSVLLLPFCSFVLTVLPGDIVEIVLIPRTGFSYIQFCHSSDVETTPVKYSRTPVTRTPQLTRTEGAFFWGYSSSSYSGLGITEYTEFQFRKERSYNFQDLDRYFHSQFFKRKPAATGAGGRVVFPAKHFPKERRVFCLF